MDRCLRLFFGFVSILAGLAGPAAAQTVASPWIDHERAQSRVVVAAGPAGKLVAFVEITMPEGWKTYWRNPGDAGGLPPSFDLTKSENVTTTRVLYPAPKRLSDRAGDTIGYKGHAIFPIEIDVATADQPVLLKLVAHFGVCREICVPLEASHELFVPPGMTGPPGGDFAEALAHVPREGAAADAPRLNGAKAISTADAPSIVFDVTFPAGAETTDMFVEAPDGLYVPMVKRTSDTQFTSTISSLPELKQLFGKPLKVTLVSKAASTETTVTLAP